MPCHLLIAAAQHYSTWGNGLPRFEVSGSGSEAVITVRNTRPDEGAASSACQLPAAPRPGLPLGPSAWPGAWAA
eukprot:11872311-Alexandrium_andersonii.AAC.1